MTYTEIVEGEPVEKTVQDPIPATHEEVEPAEEEIPAEEPVAEPEEVIE